MHSIWEVSKALHVPLDPSIKYLNELPYTISWTIRKLKQVDSFNELSKEKRPPDKILWDGTQEEIDDWMSRVMKTKESKPFKINLKDIEN